MTRRFVASSLAILLSLAPLAADHIPAMPEGVTEFQGRFALLLNTPLFDPLLEVRGALEGPAADFRYRALTLGSYVRVHPNVKLGVFYRLSAGVRHDDDWVATGGSPGWVWQDTTGRLEHQIIADVSPRVLLPFLPGRDWVLMLKARYHLSSYNLEQTVLLRPTLTWFLMVDREPLLSLALAYGFYVRLNPADLLASVLYEHAPYFEILYHLDRVVKLEVTGAWKTVRWDPSRELRDSGEPIPDGAFPKYYRAIVLGLGVLVSLSP